MKPISIDEAVLMLDEATRPFVVFRDAATDAIAVLYRRPDGHYGLVGPRS